MNRFFGNINNEFKPAFKGEKTITGNNPVVLNENQITIFNGHKIKWFIGDWSTLYNWWWAWGSFNGCAYQLCAKFNRETKELWDISVLQKGDYFNKENYDLLTKK